MMYFVLLFDKRHVGNLILYFVLLFDTGHIGDAIFGLCCLISGILVMLSLYIV